MLKLIHALDMKYENVLDYYNAFTDKRDMNNYALLKIEKGKETYYKYIIDYEELMFFLVDTENENYIIGYGSIDDSPILDFHEEFLNVGNIGYGVRPNERNKGYGSKILALLLEKCEKRGMSEVCVSCTKGNIASRKIILSYGGVFEKEFYDDLEGEGEKYWIKLNPPIINVVKRYVKIKRDY
ncbi:MAG: GNAT family N-acetyltransferase [Bacilli bacterium]|nr:GNAT family N-acetyltransferase [Bacilli bacterium]